MPISIVSPRELGCGAFLPKHVATSYQPRLHSDLSEGEAAVALAKTRRDQHLSEGRFCDWEPVDLGDDQLADPTIVNQSVKSPCRRLGNFRIVRGREGLDGPAAALEIDRRDAVDQDDVGAGGALKRPPVLLAATGPRDGGTVRVGGIGRRQEMNLPLRRRPGRVAHRPEAFDRTGERELGRAETVDEVAATDPAGLLERPKDRVHGREATLDALRRDRLAGNDTVAIQEGEACRVETLRK